MRYRCRLCFKDADKRSWAKRKPKRAPAKRRGYYLKEKPLLQTHIDTLSDRYVLNKLIGETKLKQVDLKQYPELIKLKRATIALQRELKAQRKEGKTEDLRK